MRLVIILFALMSQTFGGSLVEEISDNPCGVNSVKASCAFDCPSDFCPQDDSGEIAVCDAPQNCPPGCTCKYGYIRASPNDRSCIEPQDCSKYQK
ncbi:unnamed protein product [Diatraea saccharalis]|uniref:TIL domain-containing protein n=1 Tax=Diatraea saccharalis TaxID=40085 RepID=A0A9N9R028_9NEOP|nr:unnamed protein product [Diatraea saccharalis]